jgi:hypothetical protein
MIIGTALITSQLWQSFGSQGFLQYAAMLIFAVLLLVGARMTWRMLHPPRRPYVD